MYRIGYAWEPGELEKGADHWTLDIDYEEKEHSPLNPHGAVIQIHGETLSACMLRGKFICDLLNTKEFHACEAFIQLMELAKMVSIQRSEYKEEDDAESDS